MLTGGSRPARRLQGAIPDDVRTRPPDCCGPLGTALALGVRPVPARPPSAAGRQPSPRPGAKGADDCPMFGRTIARNMANPVDKEHSGYVERQKEQGEGRQVEGRPGRQRLRRPVGRRRPHLRRHQQRQAARPGHRRRQGRRDVLQRGRRRVPVADRPRQARHRHRRQRRGRRLDAGRGRRPPLLRQQPLRAGLRRRGRRPRRQGQGQDRLVAGHD